MKIAIDIKDTLRIIELRRMAREANTTLPAIIEGVVELYFGHRSPVKVVQPVVDSKTQTLVNKVRAAVEEYENKDPVDVKLPTGRRGPPSVLSASNQQLALTLRSQGLTHKAIADRFGVKRPVVMRLCHKHGVN